MGSSFFIITAIIFLLIIAPCSSVAGTAAMCLSWQPEEACPQYCWDGPPRCASDVHFSQEVEVTGNGGTVYFFVSGPFLGANHGPVMCGSCSFSVPCDPTDPCCSNPSDPCCGKPDEPCCKDPKCCGSTTCCDQGNSSGGGS
jgi:hypothetical protein